jgi:hypothetical protein
MLTPHQVRLGAHMNDPHPHHYVAVFGDPDALGHVHVEDGKYGHRNLPQQLRPGDMVLLYCTGTYLPYPRSVPGIGIVTRVEQATRDFWYDYLPLRQALPLDLLRFRMETADQESLANIRFDTYWFFRVSEQSFRAVMQGALLGLPLDSDTQQGPLIE